MAIIHQAQLQPTKLELLEGWLPGRPWFTAKGSGVSKVGAFRFDDPAGEVGLETILVAADEDVYQVPLSYRASPLAGAEAFLVGTMEHSVLGKRWVYDACADPCYAEVLAATVLTGQPQANHYLDVDGRLEVMPESVVVGSTGPFLAERPAVRQITARDTATGTVVRAGDLEVLVKRRLDIPAQPAPARSMTGTWEGQSGPVILAVAAGGA
ncbi:hypothetical protein [Arthrobacter sp. B3I4]|uniref:CG0192-related protein n=1 Tax=Arthrobacter sp. B3I4 TaxID=3042267 RepID=UPI0027863380|nr:hypothetical protein [Arthrobacter sp. B3I4]MDQ0756150.1 hypothetical protein [Arthrobacter sp. B3I4]